MKFTVYTILSRGVPQRLEDGLLVDAKGDQAAAVFGDYDQARNAERRTLRKKPGRKFRKVRLEWQG